MSFDLPGLDRNAGELLAAIGFGEGDLEVLRRIGAEIDRGVAPAVIRDGHPELERSRRGAAQRGEVGGELELGRKLLPDRDGDRQFEIASLTLGFDEKTVFAGSGTGRRFEPQLQFLFGIGRHDRRLDRLPAAEDCRLPALSDIRHRKSQLLRRMIEVAQRQIDRRGLAGAYGQRRIACRQIDAGNAIRGLVRGFGRVAVNRTKHNATSRSNILDTSDTNPLTCG